MTATINQLYIFLATVYGGLLIGLIYGGISVIRHVTHAGKAATIVWDIVFFVFGTAVSLCAVYIASKADLRFYTFLGLASGFCMYYFGIHAVAKGLFQGLKRSNK